MRNIFVLLSTASYANNVSTSVDGIYLTLEEAVEGSGRDMAYAEKSQTQDGFTRLDWEGGQTSIVEKPVGFVAIGLDRFKSILDYINRIPDNVIDTDGAEYVAGKLYAALKKEA